MKKSQNGKVNPKQNREKIGKTPHNSTRPIGKNNPPVETQFKHGNTASVGHGRPRKLQDLQELIYETLAEDGGALEGERKTRAQHLIRMMLVKSPSDRIALLEYAFGKVPQHLTVEDVTNKPDSELVAELQSILDSAATATRAGDSGGTAAAGLGNIETSA